MENYYKILNVPPTASASEIKRAFRKKAKELHPDIPQNAAGKTAQKANEQALLQLVEELKADYQRYDEFDSNTSALKNIESAPEGNDMPVKQEDVSFDEF